MALTNEQLLAEMEDLLRTMPTKQDFAQATAESLAWLGRASAVVEMWNPARAVIWRLGLGQLRSPFDSSASQAMNNLTVMLHEARHNFRMQTMGLTTVAISKGMVFDYFDELRKIVQMARQDVFFVDPYLDADFVSRYLNYIGTGVIIRLLARQKLQTLLPAVEAFAKQTHSTIEVRSAPNFHDRYVFVDRTACYQSGASFKDGARSAPTTLTQITDAFAAMLQTYEALWAQAKVER